MEKVGPGIYISKDVLEDEAYVLSQRCPKGVISHDDALYYYGLVDREPFVHCITIYSGYNPSALTNSGYKVYTVKKELLDLVRSRRNFEIQDFNMAIKTYLQRSDKDLNRLMIYTKAFRIEKIIRQYMEVLL